MTKINVVRREGGSRVLSVTKIIPHDWLVVQMEVIKQYGKFVTVRFEKVK